jgi:PKHD-type hydroxylase
MKYGAWYKTQEIPSQLAEAVANFVRGRELEAARTLDDNGITRRRSHVVWVNEPELLAPFQSIVRRVNRDAAWDFDVDVLEPMQYAEYYVGDEYGWHCDQHRTPYPDGRVRKFSFSIFLNDDFEGGEFDLEIHAPNVDVRYITFEKLKTNTGLFFQADMWHRVRPVTQGVRKSLVGWVLGRKFK